MVIIPELDLNLFRIQWASEGQLVGTIKLWSEIVTLVRPWATHF